jgi:ABC-type nitrate/sulfonate/bicarbonate transport system ATPase subunit
MAAAEIAASKATVLAGRVDLDAEAEPGRCRPTGVASGRIPILSAAENAGVPLRIVGTPLKECEERVSLMLSLVGLANHAKQRPSGLSGGQRRRSLSARALAGRPEFLIADEPTGQLDSQTGRQIMRLLRTVVRSEGITTLVATHDPVLIDLADSTFKTGGRGALDSLDGCIAAPLELGTVHAAGLLTCIGDA